MKSLLAILLFVTFSASCQNKQKSQPNEIVFINVNVIPMDTERILEHQVVVINNGKIDRMGTAGSVKYNKNALVIDGNGKYLLPGLAEMHAHVPPVNNIEPMKEVLLLFAMRGVTNIRGMLGHPMHLELRNKIKSGEIMGPKFYTSGPSFNGNSVKTPEAGIEMVRNQKKAGYDFLKIHPGLSLESFEAIAKTAKEVNIPFAGHVPFAVGIWRGIDANYATIDHLDGFVEGLIPSINSMTEQQVGLFGMFVARMADSTQIPRLIKGLKDHNIWVVPTQALAERWFAPGRSTEELSNAAEMKYIDANTRRSWLEAKSNLMKNQNYKADDINMLINLRRKLIYECNKNGVGLLLGSDAPQVYNVPGYSIHHELQYMVDAGLTPYEALRTATVNVGKFYRREKEMGIIRPGADSDMILLNGNPLNDISQTKNIEGVMLGNKWLSKNFIEEELKKIEGKYK